MIWPKKERNYGFPDREEILWASGNEPSICILLKKRGESEDIDGKKWKILLDMETKHVLAPLDRIPFFTNVFFELKLLQWKFDLDFEKLLDNEKHFLTDGRMISSPNSDLLYQEHQA